MALVPASDSAWNDRYVKLKEFKAEHKHCNVPQRYEKLGKWVNKQRQVYMNGNMNPRRVEMLEEVGFCWDPKQATWDLRFQQLVAFKEKSGHCNVPLSNKTLGRWVKHQRDKYKNEKLRLDRIKMLEGVEFSWNINSAWNDQYAKLKEFKAEHGHSNVPHSHKTLGRWVNHQRERFANGKLQPDRIKLLEAVDFPWDGREAAREAHWELRLQQLVEFKEKNGHCNVPRNEEVLGKWVKWQRELYKKKKLQQDRIKVLEALDFCWGIKEDVWELRFQQLIELKNKNGHCKGPYNSKDLRQWVCYQRKSYKKKKLQKDHIKMLEDIGFSWDSPYLVTPWEDRFQQLVKFKGENGHCKVPGKHEELGPWVGNQRQMFKTGKLSQERIHRLESIGFVWDMRIPLGGKSICGESVNDSIWNDWYAKLQQYKAEHGHCSVPQRHEKLGKWVNRQREVYMDGNMNPRRVEMLEEVGFRWEAKEAAWELRFQQLVAFKEKSGHCRVTTKYNHQLEEWARSQRKLYKKKKLRLDRIKMLEDIGFSWNPRSLVPWDDRFQQLVEFKGENGHCKVPARHAQLRRWVQSQREMYKTGKLLQERIDRLEGIGFVWNGTKTQIGNSLDVNGDVQKKETAEGTDVSRAQSESLGEWKDASSKHGSGEGTANK